MNIELTRGDTLKLKFIRKDSNGEAIKTQPNAIYFSVKYSAYNNETLFQKTLEDMDLNTTTGEIVFYINPTDTNKLNYGTYKYDLEVKDTIVGVDYVKTIAKGDFIIKEEITFTSNEV